MLWGQSPREVTWALQISSGDELDSATLCHDSIQSIVDVLRRNAQLVINHVDAYGSSPELFTLFKRIALAHVAIREIPDGHVDKTLMLNRTLHTVPVDGLEELLETTSELQDFYTCVNDPASATPTVEVFTLNVNPS